jgi:hypothetical protein
VADVNVLVEDKVGGKEGGRAAMSKGEETNTHMCSCCGSQPRYSVRTAC